ncbi:N-acetyltransferase [Agromyces luteolus]|uniref:GNAT family N-acetyltransferase n=1 Tax=Agromyces luteolus TaxID=88373 RepID=A0A7C9HQX9_9MICO|nr:GNAT family protein [Agromyces luteolus]MUN07269.1 GNAT family N-acetyltransferase [Agromyces luteolus]GLK28524.1 N-acetyltransferase [Agromyces luteolus]
MDLVDVWPLFGLTLRTPRLELRLVRDDDLAGLADAALSGIHDPAVMPFAFPWTDQAPDVIGRELARHVWRERVGTTPDGWTLLFAVIEDGVPIGVQDVRATRLATLRTVSTGSWLTASRQGVGLGLEMRAAVLAFCFDHLGAEVAESGAIDWNAASLGVSRRLGYVENGEKRVVSRAEHVEREVLLRLERNAFIRPEWTLEVDGFDDAVRAQLGA